MYICVSLSDYIRLYVCMYVCMDGWMDLKIYFDVYLFTHHRRQEWDATQAHFSNRALLVIIQTLPSPKWVALAKLENAGCPTISSLSVETQKT